MKEKGSGRQQPVREAIPAIRGQIVLEGESGIGKTMFLRSLVKRAQRVQRVVEDSLPAGEFADELQCMECHKMAVTRLLDEGGKSRTEWHFRHDKIADFFIVQAFLGPANDKPENTWGMPVFGVSTCNWLDSCPWMMPGRWSDG